jgi:hypothetical protein
MTNNVRTASDPTSLSDWDGLRVASLLAPGDANGDGTVDINDLTIVLANFGTTYGASSGINAVPEPSSAAVLGIGAVCLLAITRRRHGALTRPTPGA